MPPEVATQTQEAPVEEPVLAAEGDPVLEEAQTEDGLPAVAAEEPQEAAPDEKPLTQADFDRMWREREADLRRQTLEEARDLERRQRQSEEGRKAAEMRRQAQLRDAVQISLIKNLGVTEVDDATADDIISRVRNVDSSAITQGTESAINEAIAAAAAQVVGIRTEPVSADAQQYMGRFVNYMQQLLSHEAVREFVSRDAKKAWEAELPKIVEAELAKRKPAQAPMKRIDSQPAPAAGLTVQDAMSLPIEELIRRRASG